MLVFDMVLKSFPNGCMVIAAIFAIMGLWMDTILIQFGTGYDELNTYEMQYFIIWKSDGIRIVSTFNFEEQGQVTTVIADSNTYARDAYITSYSYPEIHSKFCDGDDAKNRSQILNSTSTNLQSNNQTIHTLTDQSCSGLTQIDKWLNIGHIVYYVTISFISVTIVTWIISKGPNRLIRRRLRIKKMKKQNNKKILKVLMYLCYISSISSVCTLFLLMIGYFYIGPLDVVSAILLTEFKEKRITFGQTILMLTVSIVVIIVTIYNAFYSRTPGFTFVEWNKTDREDSDDSIDA